MKYCTSCEAYKSPEAFNKNRTRYDGLGSKCKMCMKIYRKGYYSNNRDSLVEKSVIRKIKIREWFRSYKEKLVCVRCGESHIAALDFHHADRDEKEFNIPVMVNDGYSIARLEVEINKCIVLCSNCHRKLHFEEKNADVV